MFFHLLCTQHLLHKDWLSKGSKYIERMDRLHTHPYKLKKKIENYFFSDKLKDYDKCQKLK